MRLFYGFLIIFFFTFSSTSFGQQAKADDVQSVDGIISALYDVISGPAGERNWSRFSSLYKDQATMGAISEAEDGSLRFFAMTPDEYRERNDEYFKKNGFWEEEMGREVFRFGEMATVHTAFKIKSAKDGKVTRRGVNTVQLVYDQGRWWITNVTWNTEREDNNIPEQLLKDAK